MLSTTSNGGSRCRPSPACAPPRRRSATSGPTEARSRTSTLRAQAHTSRPGKQPKRSPAIERALAHPVGSPVADKVRGPGIAALAAAVDGELTRAEQLARIVADAADELGLGGHEPGRTFADLALVEVNLERHDHDTAASILHQLTQAGDAGHRPMLRSLITLHQAKLARMLGDEIGAEALLGQARRCYTEPDAAVRQMFGEEAVAQALRFDPSDGSAADRRARPASRRDARTARPPRARRPRRPRRRRHVGRPAAASDSAHPRRARRALRAQRACPRRRTGQQPPSRGARRRSARAADQHHRRPGARRPPLADVLHARRQPAGATSKTCSPPPDASCLRPGPTLRSALVEPLSPREVDVLRYLCSQLTYREIAAALYVSVNTLKSHVRSIFRKLAVTSRADAVNIGRCARSALIAASARPLASQLTARLNRLRRIAFVLVGQPTPDAPEGRHAPALQLGGAADRRDRDHIE